MHARRDVDLPHEFSQIFICKIVYISRRAVPKIRNKSRRQFRVLARFTGVVLWEPDLVMPLKILNQPIEVSFGADINSNMMVQINQRTAVHRAVMRAVGQRQDIASCRPRNVFEAPSQPLAMKDVLLPELLNESGT